MPRIFRKEGKIVGIRFPNPTRNEEKIREEWIPECCYDYDSDEQQAIHWIAQQTFTRAECTKRERWGYDLTITFAKDVEASEFANDFIYKFG